MSEFHAPGHRGSLEGTELRRRQQSRARSDRGRTPRRPSGALRAQRWLAFVAGFTIPAYLALNGGGYAVVDHAQPGLVLWWGLAIAFAFGVLPVAPVSTHTKRSLLALAALIAWTALSLAWTSSSERTVDDLSTLVGYAGVVVFALLATTRETFRNAAAGLTTAACVVSALAVASRLFPDLCAVQSPATPEIGDRLF